MYKAGDFVVHKIDGLCRISEISTLDMPDSDSSTEYYFLVPTESPSSKIYVAVGSGESSLREPISHDEAVQLIDSLPEIEQLPVPNEKLRQSAYNQALIQNDCQTLFSLIKTTYARKAERLSRGRSATSMDERFLKSAEKALYSELSYALGMKPDKITDYITSRLDSE